MANSRASLRELRRDREEAAEADTKLHQAGQQRAPRPEAFPYRALVLPCLRRALKLNERCSSEYAYGSRDDWRDRCRRNQRRGNVRLSNSHHVENVRVELRRLRENDAQTISRERRSRCFVHHDGCGPGTRAQQSSSRRRKP